MNPPPDKRPRVLVVEDEPANRRIVRRWMARLGFELFEAHDGPAGLQAAINLQPDCVLLDMSLPGMTGWEVARQLRADPLGRQLYIIALTAHAMDNDHKRCIDAGCDHFFSKPASFPQIGRLIQSRLEQGGVA